ncbi:alanine and proline-rich secreted protein Apa [Mycobacterium lepromatosis]|uniref:Alanine and proline-rich secreted protein Apa n=1 Tax=Mycobacterium lepromatosis TaxID=480418 RepID=A0A0F4ET25_9MYCO|nr:alanine and proline-rich secreted protein Apa [Mycobacterium lepromatosis]KJX74785.1 cell surface protein [Mycobacterium lepromatosis]UKN43061.1 alanine and proline-rich secreted protein Apa [Mycobacterium lepromatosis]
MNQVDPNATRRKGLWATLAIAAVASVSAVTMPLPAAANADPAPLPPSTATAAPSPAQEITTSLADAPVSSEAQQGDSDASPLDLNALSPPAVDSNAGRITNAVGGFSFVLPAGWVESDSSHLDYGSALLSKAIEQPPMPGQPPPVASDTRIVLGRLDQKLYASAEADNVKAAVRLGSDMGEFYLPYPGTRINQEIIPLNANGIAGSASYYDVKFSDPNKPIGQICTSVVGLPAASTPEAGPLQRWFVVWLGTSNNPVDKGAAKELAESIRPEIAPAPAG